MAIAGYNFQCSLLGKAVSEPESLPGSREGGRKAYQEFYRAGSLQRCDSPPPPHAPHFTLQLKGVGWGLKKVEFLLPAASWTNCGSVFCHSCL